MDDRLVNDFECDFSHDVERQGENVPQMFGDPGTLTNLAGELVVSRDQFK